jgi:AcrR family transcriptional regulator
MTAPVALAGTKRDIVLAAIETLRRNGYHGASAREIARIGAFNQALIFYHFGSVQKLMLAALDYVSERRLEAYKPSFEAASTVPELAALAHEIYAADLEQGFVTVLAELVAGGMSDTELGQQVFERIRPWLSMVEAKLGELVSGTALERIVPARDAAFAIVALYLGIDLMSQLLNDRAAAESLLDLGTRYAPAAQALLS